MLHMAGSHQTQGYDLRDASHRSFGPRSTLCGAAAATMPCFAAGDSLSCAAANLLHHDVDRILVLEPEVFWGLGLLDALAVEEEAD